jgi:hypothetical protein
LFTTNNRPSPLQNYGYKKEKQQLPKTGGVTQEGDKGAEEDSTSGREAVHQAGETKARPSCGGGYSFEDGREYD